MKTVSLASSLLLVLFAILHIAVSLPPDFFRSGRGQMTADKRAVQEFEVMRGICSFCGLIEADENVGLDCLANKPAVRSQCAIAQFNFLANYMEKKGWK